MRKLLCVAALVCAASSSYAQDAVWMKGGVRMDAPVETRANPANDECVGSGLLICNTTTVVDLTQMTTNATDPLFACAFGGARQGVNSAWYRFVAGSTTAHLVTGPQTGTPAVDTLLAVYSGTCGAFTQIACNDDIGAGNLFSELNLTGLTPGKVYYVEVAAYTASRVGIYTLEYDAPPPANDSCSNPIALTCNGFARADLGSATIAASDPLVSCALGGARQAPGSVWFQFIASGSTARLETSAVTLGEYDDPMLMVFGGTCGNLVPIACNDDSNSGLHPLASRVDLTNLTIGATYLVEVTAWTYASQISYDLLLECPGDCVNCPIGAYQEAELCGPPAPQDTPSENGGCNASPIAFEDIPCATTYCGTASYDGTTRDTDWLRFTVETPSVVQLCGHAQYPLQLGLFTANCSNLVAFINNFFPACTDQCGSATLLPGTYVVFVAPQFTGVPIDCNDGAQWQITMTSDPICPGDFNGDGRVNTLDLAKLLSSFGNSVSTCSVYDLDHNGIINTVDLAKLLGKFGVVCATDRPAQPLAIDAKAVTGTTP